MFFLIQDFAFAQNKSNLPKSNHFCPNFASILSNFCLNFSQILTKSNKICPNLTNFAQKILLEDASLASPAPTALHQSVNHRPSFV